MNGSGFKITYFQKLVKGEYKDSCHNVATTEFLLRIWAIYWPAVFFLSLFSENAAVTNLPVR